MKTNVVIIGAGPVGLTLAAECWRHGVSFRIIDQAPGPSTHSKALAIWSGTLECLDAIGVAESFFQAGRPIRKMVFADAGRKIAEVPLTEGLDTVWSKPLILPQSETERLLLAFLHKQGVSIARNTECVEVLTVTEGGVVCKTLRHFAISTISRRVVVPAQSKPPRMARQSLYGPSYFIPAIPCWCSSTLCGCAMRWKRWEVFRSKPVEHCELFSTSGRLIAVKRKVLKRFSTLRAELTRDTEHGSRAGT